eukprot:gnl/Spiro4/27676_TR13793_c0_g1_i1.p1 gnl/Spiro4/27676_TR13793_c0_g1~~gnl/Spiro4/27676_TR13793_c0_g1_i1.p1  ORF type:complete len:585 (-),score=152.19 gnl/Spiro4/27676_TR13793_c0_g1_i1:77-1756(-)
MPPLSVRYGWRAWFLLVVVLVVATTGSENVVTPQVNSSSAEWQQQQRTTRSRSVSPPPTPSRRGDAHRHDGLTRAQRLLNAQQQQTAISSTTATVYEKELKSVAEVLPLASFAANMPHQTIGRRDFDPADDGLEYDTVSGLLIQDNINATENRLWMQEAAQHQQKQQKFFRSVVEDRNYLWWLWPSDTIHVKVKINIGNIHDIDPSRDRFGAVIYLQSEWRDPALQFNPEDLDGVTELSHINRELYLWRPSLHFVNGIIHPTPLDDLRDEAYLVEKDGRVHWSEKTVNLFAQQFDFTYFPFDYQQLTVLLDTRIPRPDGLSFGPRITLGGTGTPIEIDQQFSLQEWDILAAWIDEISDNNESQLRVVVLVKRQWLPYVLSNIVVTLVICGLAHLTFFLSVREEDVRDRITITVFLTLILQVYVIMTNMPKMRSPCIVHYLIIFVILIVMLALFAAFFTHVCEFLELFGGSALPSSMADDATISSLTSSAAHQQQHGSTSTTIYLYQKRIDQACRWGFGALFLAVIVSFFVVWHLAWGKVDELQRNSSYKFGWSFHDLSV